MSEKFGRRLKIEIAIAVVLMIIGICALLYTASGHVLLNRIFAKTALRDARIPIVH